MTAWDRITGRAGWALLVLFTALSAYLNARAALLEGPAGAGLIAFHAGIPAVLLVAGLFAELVALSGVHRAAKWVTVTVLTSIFAVTMIASYIAVLAVVQRWNPHAPTWVNQALAAVPDAAMLMAGTVVLSLRMRRHGLAPATPQPRPRSPWRPVADAAAARAEAALTAPGEGSATPSVGVTEGVREPVRRPSPKRAAKPVADPSLEPFMDRARELENQRLVRGKTAADYAKLLHAIDAGWSPTRIKKALGASHGTTAKVAAAAGEGVELTAV